MKKFIPKHGGYATLLSYQKAEVIYDGTVYFTQRFFSKFDRTVDPMVQAARSGKQNITEASVASGTSKVAVFLLGRQIDNLKQDFLKNGGLRERMTKARQEVRRT